MRSRKITRRPSDERALPWVVKAGALYRVLPNHRSELIEAVTSYRRFYNYERLHMSLGIATGYGVFKKGRS